MRLASCLLLLLLAPYAAEAQRTFLLEEGRTIGLLATAARTSLDNTEGDNLVLWGLGTQVAVSHVVAFELGVARASEFDGSSGDQVGEATTALAVGVQVRPLRQAAHMPVDVAIGLSLGSAEAEEEGTDATERIPTASVTLRVLRAWQVGSRFAVQPRLNYARVISLNGLTGRVGGGGGDVVSGGLGLGARIGSHLVLFAEPVYQHVFGGGLDTMSASIGVVHSF